jgi:hypothetical protein
MAGNAIPVDGQDFIPEDLPILSCASYEDVLMAREACNGEFLMWGEYLESESNNTKKSLFGIGNSSIFYGTSVDGASYGPYYCSGCSGNSTTDYGFVGGQDGENLPPVISGFSQASTLFGSAFCTQPYVEAQTREDLSCQALQRYCEETGLGWLTHANTFETATGSFTCSGGCEGEVLFADQKITSLEDINFASWPMLIMWGMIVFFLVLASILDYCLFIGDKREWLIRYFLHQFGYVNLKGEKQNCRSVCKNPCECLCFFCRRGDNSCALWFRFLSVTFLSLGVSILFGDGFKHEHVCFFDASPMAVTSNYSDVLHNATWVHSYGQQDGPGSEDGPVIEFNMEWVISELAIVLYSTSQEMLSYNLVRTEFMTEVASSSLMLLCSCIFTLCSYIFYLDTVNFENLYILWLSLLVISYVLLSIIGGLSYIFAALMVRCFRCKIPESDETKSLHQEDNSGKNTKVDKISPGRPQQSV